MYFNSFFSPSQFHVLFLTKCKVCKYTVNYKYIDLQYLFKEYIPKKYVQTENETRKFIKKVKEAVILNSISFS